VNDSPPKDDKPLNLPKAIGIFVVAIAIGVGLIAAELITPTTLGLLLAAVGGGLVPFTRIR